MTFEEALEKNGKIVYTNVGVSMLPLLREGKDLMVIDRIRKPLRKYDAVLFRRPGVEGRGKYVLHRILRVNEERGEYYIIGDNCLTGEVVHRENILGLLTAVHRGKKTIFCDTFLYNCSVRVWWTLYPVRKFYKRMRGVAGRIKRKLLSFTRKV